LGFAHTEKDLVSQRACLRWSDAGGFEERPSYLLNEDYWLSAVEFISFQGAKTFENFSSRSLILWILAIV